MNDSAQFKMQDDMFPAAEKILSDIENVVKKDTPLKGFEIIPAEDNENKSPVFHQEDCLGLASWCVQPLYCYAYRRLFEYRQNKHRREEPATVARWLLGALLLNPDVTTFWNMRRELVRNRKLEPSEELLFARVVLYHKPKCFEAFAYRRWILSYILDSKEEPYNPVSTESPLSTELQIATTCADMYANNYHAWSHRRHVMTLCESRGYSHPSLDSEWKNTLAWCQKHVSDYSGLSYRQFLLRKYVFESGPALNDPFTRCTDAIDYEQLREELFVYMKSNIRGVADEDHVHYKAVYRLQHADSKASSSNRERQTCFRALSYWLEECRANENMSYVYDFEALWHHRRYLAYLLMCIIVSYKKHSCYREELADLRIPNKSSGSEDLIEKTVPDDEMVIIHDYLVDAFCSCTGYIAKYTLGRDQQNKIFFDRFFKFLRSIGFKIS